MTHDVLVGAKWQKNDGSDGGATQKPSDKPSTPAKKPSSKPDDAGKETLVQTGDSAFAQVPAAFTAGVAVLFTGLASIAAERTRRDFSLRRVAESRSSQEVREARPRKERVPLVARGRRSSSLEGAGAACLRKRRRALREAGGA